MRGLGNPFRIRLMKINLRIAVINGVVWERDEVGAINLGLKYLKKILKQMGGVMAYPSTGSHEVWVKLMNPHQGPTPLKTGERYLLVKYQGYSPIYPLQ